MKYSKVRVKCSDQLLLDLDKFKEYCGEKASDVVLDFIEETTSGIIDVMADARLTHSIEDDGIVFAEFMITIPEAVWVYVKEFIEGKEDGYEEIEMFFEEIARIQKGDFKR